MSDKNDTRREFEAFVLSKPGSNAGTIYRKNFPGNGAYWSSSVEFGWISWQAATGRAAKVVEAMTERRRMNSSQKPDCEYAAAIRQGNAK